MKPAGGMPPPAGSSHTACAPRWPVRMVMKPRDGHHAAVRPQRRRRLGPVLDQGDRAVPVRRTRQRRGAAPRHHRPHEVWIGERYYTVVGVLAPVTLDAGIDRAALIGLEDAEAHWDADGRPCEGLAAHRRRPVGAGPVARRPDGEPRGPRGGRGLPAVRCPGGQGCRRGRLHLAPARPWRGRPAIDDPVVADFTRHFEDVPYHGFVLTDVEVQSIFLLHRLRFRT